MTRKMVSTGVAAMIVRPDFDVYGGDAGSDVAQLGGLGETLLAQVMAHPALAATRQELSA